MPSPRTQQAIMNFQTDQNQSDPSIAIDGEVGPQTSAALVRMVGA